MKKYDYLIVGAGLFGSVFAHEAVKCGKTCLVIDKRITLAEIFIQKRLRGSRFTNMAPIFFTHPIKPCGIM